MASMSFAGSNGLTIQPVAPAWRARFFFSWSLSVVRTRMGMARVRSSRRTPSTLTCGAASGITITAARFLGLDRDSAARFSFLCSLPSIFAAGVYELYKERAALVGSQADAVNLIAATFAAGIVGYWSIGFLLRILRTRTTLIFIIYRLIVGFALLGLLSAGVLDAY